MAVQTKVRKAVQPALPVLRVTRFDQVSAWLIALVLGLGFSVVALTAVWVAMRPKTSQNPVPVEIVELSGGVPDGAVNETLQMESPEEIAEDPSLAEVEAPETEIEESLDNVLDLADEATNLATQQFETDSRSAGKPGSKRGTGRRALGMGPGEGGFPRDERWFIAYSNEAGLDRKSVV